MADRGGRWRPLDAQRRRVPRAWESGQGRRSEIGPRRLESSPGRPDPVETLRAQATTRVQELVPIRYGRMLVSPFTFYRGAAAIMAADLATTPDSGIVVQVCGDAHISNFGAFAVPDRRLVFGPNDFDETLPGPWEWDVKRMAASVEIAARDVGLPAARRRRLVKECVREYREGMRAFANESHLDVWYDRLNASELVDRFGGRLGPRGRILFTKTFAKGRRKTSLRAVDKLTHGWAVSCASEASRRCSSRCASSSMHRMPTSRRNTSANAWSSTPPGSTKTGGSCSAPTSSSTWHARLSASAASGRVPGWCCSSVAAVWTRWCYRQRRLSPRCWSLTWRQHIREPRRTGRPGPADLPRCHRHLPQLATQPGSRRQGARLYVRQLWDWKVSADLSAMPESGLHAYTRACGWSMARSHARSGDRLAIAAYLGADPSSTGRSPGSQRRTPTRTNRTTSA